MEFAQTENQQLLMFKQCIKKYFKLGLVLLLLLLVILVAGNYWRKNRLIAANAASQIFQEMVFADLQQDPSTATAKGEQLMTDYANSPYAQLAALVLAKMAVNDNNFAVAAEKLQWVIAQKKANKLAGHIATIHLAAVLQQQGKLDEALALVVKDPTDKAYLPVYAQMRGDLYAAHGDIEQAKQAYKLALQSLPAGAQVPLLQMKLLDLGGEAHA